MRHISTLLLSTTTLALTLALTPGVHAQQQASSSAAAMSAPADNSAVNARDRSAQTTTPFDQPNDKTDIKLAAAVRRAIVKDKSLSMSAHNIKLVAAGGVVTLRGPVDSAAEKARIETVVQGIAGVSRVDNQLDVKTQH
jgi:hyperosmotically inducible protein